MPHDDAQDRHDHSPSSGDTYGRCCGSKAIGPTKVKASDGRSFHVSGLDCAEEVSILNRVVGPEVGGTEYLAFDVINARMTVLDGGKNPSSDKIIAVVGTTGMAAKTWDAEDASADQAARLKKQKLFTMLSGGFWAAGFVYHLVESGISGAISIFSGHGEVSMPLIEITLFASAILLGVWLVAPKAWSSARRFSPDMNLLISRLENFSKPPLWRFSFRSRCILKAGA